MKANVKHLLVGGGIVLGAAACGFLVWWVSTPLPSDSVAAGTPPQTGADSSERAAPGALPVPLPSPPDLEEMLRQAGAPAAATARAESAARMDGTIAEARRRAEEDPKAAMAWALQQGAMVRTALGAVVEVWGRTDPAAAFEALRWVPDDEASRHRFHGLGLLIDQWTAADPSAAWKAVGTLSASLDAAVLKGRIASLWSESDPAAAAASLKALTSGGRSKEDQQYLQSAFSTVGHRLAEQNGTKAAEWALGFAEASPERANAVAGVVSGWYGKDAKAVSDWLNAMEDGVVHDTGAAALVTLCMESAPETSLQWAQAILNEGQRSLLTMNVAMRWLTADPEKAEAWVRGSTALSAEQRETILANARLVRGLSGADAGK